MLWNRLPSAEYSRKKFSTETLHSFDQDLEKAIALSFRCCILTYLVYAAVIAYVDSWHLLFISKFGKELYWILYLAIRREKFWALLLFYFYYEYWIKIYLGFWTLKTERAYLTYDYRPCNVALQLMILLIFLSSSFF